MKSIMNETATDGCRMVKTAVDHFSVGAADDAQDDFTVLQIHWQSEEKKRKIFVFHSVVQEESRMLDEVFTFLDFHAVEPAIRQKFAVAVSEAFSNALIHGNQMIREKKITLSLSLNHGWLRADIEDEGRGGLARINRKSQPTVSSESGRGVDLIRHYSQAEFAETPQGGLRVTIRMQVVPGFPETEK
jgi:anti-sigma regulatory factor (Ser/Thr protein kinase)